MQSRQLLKRQKVSSENLEIQIVSEGKAGFLGFGAKPAIIKAAKKEVEKSLPKEPKKKPVEKVKEEVKPVKPAEPEIAKEIEKETEAPREEKKVVVRSEEEIANMKAEAEKFLSGVFKAMNMEVEVSVQSRQLLKRQKKKLKNPYQRNQRKNRLKKLRKR